MITGGHLVPGTLGTHENTEGTLRRGDTTWSQPELRHRAPGARVVLPLIKSGNLRQFLTCGDLDGIYSIVVIDQKRFVFVFLLIFQM